MPSTPIQLEVTNILLMASRRRIAGLELRQLSDAFDALPISIQPPLSPHQRAEVLRLAQKHELTSYDAAYLELAMRLAAPLASFDAALIKAATAEGVQLSANR